MDNILSTNTDLPPKSNANRLRNQVNFTESHTPGLAGLLLLTMAGGSHESGIIKFKDALAVQNSSSYFEKN
jgi:hypothetical protein